MRGLDGHADCGWVDSAICALACLGLLRVCRVAFSERERERKGERAEVTVQVTIDSFEMLARTSSAASTNSLAAWPGHGAGV
jgi:hypothetical protein